MAAGIPIHSSDRFASTLHTLCGSALTAKEKNIASIANKLEDYVGSFRRSSRALDNSAWQTVAATVDSLSAALDARVAGESAEGIATPALTRLRSAAAGLKPADKDVAAKIDRVAEPVKTAKQKDMHDQLFLIFTDEADLILGKLQRMHAELEVLSTRATLANSEDTPTEQQQRVILRDALRQLHTLKGSARVAGCESMAILSHHIENGWLNWLQARSEINDRRLDLFEASIDALQISLEQARNGEAAGDFDMLVAELNEDLELGDSSKSSPAYLSTELSPEAQAEQDVWFDQTLELIEPDTQAYEPVNQLSDDTQIFATTSELETTVETDVDPAGAATVAETVSESEHASEPVSDATTETAEFAAESAVDSAVKTGGLRVDGELLDQLSSLSTRISMQHAELQQGMSLLGDSLLDLDKASVMLRQKLRDLDLETSLLPEVVETELTDDDDNDQTLSLAAAYGEPATMSTSASTSNPLATDEDRRQLSEVLHDLDTIRDALHERLRQEGETLSQSSRLTADIHESVLKAKLVRFDSLSQRLHSIVRQAARSLGKQVEFKLHGGDIAIDQGIHRQLAAPLEHLLRNAVAHGIEDPALRQRAGKAAQGLIDLRVRLNGNNLKITLSDDGGGVNYERLRELSADDSATDAQLLARLPEQGLSTRREPDMLSGRGVGLATAHSQLAAIQGQLVFTRSDASGTEISIAVPLPMQIRHTAVFEINGFHLGIAADCVQSVKPSSAMQAVAGGFKCDTSDTVGVGDTLYQPLDVDRIVFLGQDSDNAAITDEPDTASKLLEQENDTSRFLLLQVAGEHACIKLDRLIGFRDLIVHPPGRQLDSLGFYSGVSQQVDGTKVLLLDVAQLLELQGSIAGSAATGVVDKHSDKRADLQNASPLTSALESPLESQRQSTNPDYRDATYNILSPSTCDPAEASTNSTADRNNTQAHRDFVDQVDFAGDTPTQDALPDSHGLDTKRNKRVMIVDDSVTLRTYTRGVVESRGLKPIDARDGLEALQALKHVQHPPDLLIVDVEMPRMDGFQLVSAIRELDRYKKMPVVMISSRTGASYRHRAAKLGVVAYLGKPYYPEELSSILDNLGMIESDGQLALSTE